MKSLRFIAISEITGGTLLVLGTAATLNNSQIPLWYQAASFLLSFYAIAAGISLWKNNSLGRWFSLMLQAIQLVQFATTNFLLKILVGFHLSVFIFSGGGLNIAPGVAGSLGLWGPGHTQTPGMGINLLALGSLLLFLIKRAATPETNRSAVNLTL